MDAGARNLPRLGARQSARGAGDIAIVAVGDPHDPRVADYRNIPDPERVERCDIFIAEGRLVVHRLLTRSPLATRSVMVTEAALEDVRPALAAHPDVPVYVVPQPVMNEIAGFNIHRGCLAIGERPEPRDWRNLARDARRLVILERIGDPDNVGSAFRNSAAFGVDGVLLDPATTDPLYRKAIRTSMGATLFVPFARIGRPGPSLSADLSDEARRAKSEARGAEADGPGDWPRALDELDREGVAVVALTPSSAAPCLRTIAEQLSNRRVALVLGHEGDGLTQGALDACGLRARIPMAPGADSINIAAAAAIALYELGGKWKV